MIDVRHLFHRITPALPIAILLSSAVHAQPIGLSPGTPLVGRSTFSGPGPNLRRDCGPGVGWSYYGVRGGPSTAFTDWRVGVWNWGWGGFPAANGSFWTNGLSLYGPPVPTYAPVPGSFGGTDAHRVYMNPPIFGYGLTAWGYRSAYARLATPSVSVHPPATALPAPTSAGCARVEVRLAHPDAELWVNHAKTTATGVERSFETPELSEGKRHSYELIARWTVNGEPKAESRTVQVERGKTVLVSFAE